MSKLDDLPSLGGGLGGNNRGGQASFNVDDVDDSGGFGDFDINEDRFGDSSNKFDDAERMLSEANRDEREGFRI